MPVYGVGDFVLGDGKNSVRYKNMHIIHVPREDMAVDLILGMWILRGMLIGIDLAEN